jgi:hypothetical protein
MDRVRTRQMLNFYSIVLLSMRFRCLRHTLSTTLNACIKRWLLMNKKNNYLGIMLPNNKHMKAALKPYLNYKMTELKLFCFTPSTIDWNRKEIIGLQRLKQEWVLRTFPFPQVVYNRCYKKNHEVIGRLKSVIGSNKFFNDTNQFNKYEIHETLWQGLGYFLPETVPYDKDSATRLLEIHRELYLKPCNGHSGKGVYRVKMKDSGEVHIGPHYFSPNIIVGDVMQFSEKIHGLLGSTPYIIQQGIDPQQLNDKNFDLRVLVQKNKFGAWSITNVVSRIAFAGCFNTSVCEKVCLSEEILHLLYPPDMANAILLSIHDISLKSAEIIEANMSIHLGEICVDFVIDKAGHPWVMEVNGKPDKSLYDGIPKNNLVYSRPLQYAQYLCQH